MINVLLVGCLGRIGTEISKYIASSKDFKIVAGLDLKSDPLSNYIVYKNFNDIINDKIVADVIIDFSNPSSLTNSLTLAQSMAAPLVLGTTGFDENQKLAIFETSKKLPIFWAANMSNGINLLIKACEAIISLSDDLFDIDIVETHHNKKLDAPSATAKMIASFVKLKSDSLFPSKKFINFNSFNFNQPRNKNEIRLHSIRSGDCAGKHSVTFSTSGETLSISHVASSKTIFAKGALKAARFILNQQPGLFGSRD